MLSNLPIMAIAPASDLDRARRFYEGVLGFTPNMDNPGGVMYPCGGGTTLFVYPTQFAGTGKHTVVSWQANDLRKLVRDLKARGVVFEEYDFPGLKTVDGIADMGDGSLGAWFKDSEGNILGVFQG